MVAFALMGLGITVQANVLDLGDGFTNLETVVVGDAVNIADTLVMDDGTTGYGKVDYIYNIGKYEVTTGQYCDFLNYKAKTDIYALYNPYMGIPASLYWGCNIQRSGISGSYVYTVGTGSINDIANWANRPVNYISYFDALRFANWINNGQGDGDTETGAYTMEGWSEWRNIPRNTGWTWAVASEDEWYKAAYYKGGGNNTGYWVYATRSDTLPGRDLFDLSGNNANYYDTDFLIGNPYYRTTVGEFKNSSGPFGTFDQGGNILEWIGPGAYQQGSSYSHLMRGGSWSNLGDSLRASSFTSTPKNNEQPFFGFRVSKVYGVPAESSISATVTLKLYDGLGSTVPITVELSQDGAVKRSDILFLNNSNRFMISGVASGLYDIRIKASHWLSVTKSSINVTSAIDLGTVALKNGDVDGDNEVTSTDLSILGLALGSTPGDSNWDSTADLDGDNEITSTDLSILGLSLGMAGD